MGSNNAKIPWLLKQPIRYVAMWWSLQNWFYVKQHPDKMHIDKKAVKYARVLVQAFQDDIRNPSAAPV